MQCSPEREQSRQTMPFEYVIHEAERYVEVSFHGILDVGAVLGYLQHVWLNRPSIAGFSELIDFRGVEGVNLNTGELAQLVHVGRALDDTAQHSKIAMIADNPYMFFKGELYQTLQQLYPAKNKDVEIFKDCISAKAWLVS